MALIGFEWPEKSPQRLLEKGLTIQPSAMIFLQAGLLYEEIVKVWELIGA